MLRLIRVLLLAASVSLAAAADLPTDLAAALKSFRADVPRGWTYLQTTTAEGKSTVERHDAAKPDFDRWSLVRKDGRAPTAEESREYFEGRTRRSRGGTAPKLVEQLDLGSLESVSRDDQHATFRCRLKPAESGDRVADFLRATIKVHHPSATIEAIELSSIGAFRPTLGVRIAEMRTRMTYSLPAGDRPSLPLRVESRVRGTAFFFKTLDADMTVVFSDFARVGPR